MSSKNQSRDRPRSTSIGRAGSVRGRLASRTRGGAIGLVVLLGLLVTCIALIVAVVVKTHDDAALAAREASAYTPPVLATPDAEQTRPTVVVISDEAAIRAAAGTTAAQRWPQVMAKSLNAKVTVIATAGAGYATADGSDEDFVEAAQQIPSTAETVLFVGGAADVSASSLSLARAATQAFSAASKSAPDATLIAVGPLFRPTTISAADMSTIRRTLQSASSIAGVKWVDPISSDWTSNVESTGDMTAAAQRTIAARMRAAVEGTTD